MKNFLVIAVLFTAFAAVNAQTQSATQSANVNLSVQTALTLTNVRALTFGNQVQGATAVTIDPVTGGASTAYFTLTGAPAGQLLTVSWTSSADLSYTSTTGTTNIAWTPGVAVNNSTSQTGASTITSGGTFNADGTGHLWIWVGGTIASIPLAAPAGAYQGAITLTVQY